MDRACIDTADTADSADSADSAKTRDTDSQASGAPRASVASVAGTLHRKLRALRAVVAVIEHASVTQAAHALHLSPSAVARAISDIEETLGVALFQRTARGLVPNPAGDVLGARAARALAELANGHRDALARAPRRDGSERGPARFAAVVTAPQLTSFVAVAEFGSGALAAQRLHCAQPTIQRNLDQLEALAGMKLFRRTPKGTQLTDDGLALLGPVKRALSELATAECELGRFAGRRHGSVVVAALPLSCGYLLPQAIERLLRRRRHVSVTIVDGTYDALIHRLRHADVDMIVGALRAHGVQPDIHQEALFEDALRVVARAGHPCFDKPVKSLADLTGYDWIAPLPGTPGRETFERAFANEGLDAPKARLHVNNPGALRGLLSGSDRFALVSPLQIAEELRCGALAVLPVPVRGATRSIGVATRSECALSRDALDMIEELRAVSATVPTHF